MKQYVVIKAGAWWDLTPEARKQLRRWMKENKLEANDVPAGEEVIVEVPDPPEEAERGGAVIVHWAIQRDDDGKVRTERNDQGELRVLAEERRTPLLTPPPGLTLPV